MRGAPRGGTFSLTDHHGDAVSDSTYRGNFMLLFFGFTRCRAVCPRALRRLSDALDAIGAEAQRIQPLYITVDPERDTPAVMKAFLEQDYPRFTGLTGSRDAIDKVKALYRVFAKRAADADDPDGYQMPHTALTYLIDPNGRYVAHFTEAMEQAELTDRLRYSLRLTS